jgi:Uma2 family endonuclease
VEDVAERLREYKNMAARTAVEPMTTEALLALPDNGMERWLIRGQLREKPMTGQLRERRMTVRNRWHSRVLASLTACVKNWRDAQPEPRGDVLSGDDGVRLTHGPDTTVGIDIAYVSPEVLARQTDETTLIDGVPLLAVEILSPSETVDEINEKIDAYLAAGVPLVWIIDPYRRTAAIYRPQKPARLVAEGEELSGEAVLPGFRVPVADLFR